VVGRRLTLGKSDFRAGEERRYNFVRARAEVRKRKGGRGQKEESTKGPTRNTLHNGIGSNRPGKTAYRPAVKRKEQKSVVVGAGEKTGNIQNSTNARGGVTIRSSTCAQRGQ